MTLRISNKNAPEDFKNEGSPSVPASGLRVSGKTKARTVEMSQMELPLDIPSLPDKIKKIDEGMVTFDEELQAWYQDFLSTFRRYADYNLRAVQTLQEKVEELDNRVSTLEP